MREVSLVGQGPLSYDRSHELPAPGDGRVWCDRCRALYGLVNRSSHPAELVWAVQDPVTLRLELVCAGHLRLEDKTVMRGGCGLG